MLAADLRRHFGVGLDDIDLREGERLAVALLNDITTCTHAAVAGYPMPLGQWMRVRTLNLLAGLSGVEPGWPQVKQPEQPPEADEIAAAEALLDRYSAIRRPADAPTGEAYPHGP